jgi:hypothetical protein
MPKKRDEETSQDRRDFSLENFLEARATGGGAQWKWKRRQKSGMEQ